jgi:hypothetical protein
MPLIPQIGSSGLPDLVLRPKELSTLSSAFWPLRQLLPQEGLAAHWECWLSSPMNLGYWAVNFEGRSPLKVQAQVRLGRSRSAFLWGHCLLTSHLLTQSSDQSLEKDRFRGVRDRFLS